MQPNELTSDSPSLTPPTSIDTLVSNVETMLKFDGELNIAPNGARFFNALMASKAIIHMVDISDVRLMDGFNPRLRDASFDEHIRELADSMKVDGFYKHKPLYAVPSYENKRAIALVADGECRYRAALLANSEGAEIEYLPVVFADKATTQEDLVVSLIKSNGGKRFAPLELSIVAKRLLKFGNTPGTIAKRLGFTVEYVHQLLTIAGAPHLIRQMLEEGTISAGLAVSAIRKHGSDAPAVLQEAVKQAKESGKRSATNQHMPDQIDRKVMAKAAPVIMSAFERIRSDASFDTLPESIKATLEKAFADIAAVREKALAKAGKDSNERC